MRRVAMLFISCTYSITFAPRAEARSCPDAERRPTLTVNLPWRAEVDQPQELTVEAVDPLGGALTVTAEELPAGAKLELDPPQKIDCQSFVHGRITWTPDHDDVGRHAFRLSATNTLGRTEFNNTVEVVEEFNSYAMPGVSYSAYLPHESASSGGFQGASAEFLLASWVHRNENHGPSHTRLFLDLDLLAPVSPKEQGKLYSYTLGLDLSVERNPKRRFLIPYYGLEAGGLYNVKYGQVAQLVPFAGVHLWASRNLWIDASAGYLLPGKHLDELGGVRGKVGADFSLW